MKMLLCDLHTHSTFSDGSCSPKELLETAKAAGLVAVALTDHNTVDGLKTFLTDGKNYGIEAVAGVEISCDYNGKELHVLALFIENRLSEMQKFLEISKSRKEESNKLLAENLVNKGYKIDYEQIKLQTVGSINRVHFANELIKKGYIKTVKEGFDTVLSENAGFYLPPKRLTVFEVIDFIKTINAISVLAHPLLNLTKEELIEFLPEAKQMGLKAIETRYSKYSIAEQEFCTRLAKDFGFLESGGSDFHGANKPDIKIGVGQGGLQVPYKFLEAIKNSIEACKV